mmetsp:Transcript_112436/g.195027  ORF Transcript_112436/g.195027 Transcript_112436/m.195027 type:complete len:227 (+) Transcript_112436:1630-2310(+)
MKKYSTSKVQPSELRKPSYALFKHCTLAQCFTIRTNGTERGTCNKRRRIKRSVKPLATPSKVIPTDTSTSTSSPSALVKHRMTIGTRICLKSRFSFTERAAGNHSSRCSSAATFMELSFLVVPAPHSFSCISGSPMQMSRSEPARAAPCRKEPKGLTVASSPKACLAVCSTASTAAATAASKEVDGSICERTRSSGAAMASSCAIGDSSLSSLGHSCDAAESSGNA